MKVGYIRTSTDHQFLDRQIKALNEHGVEKMFIEQISGKSMDRPQLKAMLDYVREGDCLYIESLSRLGRNLSDLFSIVDSLEHKKCGLKSLSESFIDTTTPQGKLVFSIFGALAQFQREELLQKQRQGIECAKARGAYKGKPQTKKPQNWEEVISEWKAEKITAVEAQKRLGLKPNTFYRMVKREK